MRSAVLISLKIAALVICLAFIFQGRPPAGAQTVQDTKIAELNQHLTHTDGVVDADANRIRNIELQVSEMLGEERVAFAVIGILSSGSIILQVKKKD